MNTNHGALGLTWAKPKNAWQWLLLISPAILVMTLPWLLTWCLDSADTYGILNYLVVSLCLSIALCFFLGAWLARPNPTVGKKITAALLCAICLAIVNVGIAFGGCMIIGSTF